MFADSEYRDMSIFAGGWGIIMPATVAAAAAKSLQSCPTLCDPTDGSPPGSPVPGILQARTLEWIAISFSNAWKWKVKVKSLSRVWLLATPWTTAHQAPPSMGFSRQEYWSGVPLPSPACPSAGLQIRGLDQLSSNSAWLWLNYITSPSLYFIVCERGLHLIMYVKCKDNPSTTQHRVGPQSAVNVYWPPSLPLAC